MASDKIFVNSAWIKNVPAKSPQGTPLQAGVNAFASIDAALNKYPDDLGEKQVILLDRAQTVYNTKSGTDINFTAIASQEIDKDSTKNANTATSTVIAGGDLSLIYNAEAGADEAELGGFLNVNLTTQVGDANTQHTVLGGKNVATHTYIATDVWEKGTAAVTSVAVGTLNANKSNVALASGTFSPVEETEGFDITEDEPFFSVIGLGDPAAFDFESGDVSVLSSLSGYAVVTLKNGSTATELRGGVQNYSVSSLASYNNDDEPVSVVKAFAYNSAASGSLTAEDSTVGTAVGYAAATITDSSFEALNAFSVAESARSAYAMNKVTRFDTDLVAVSDTEVLNSSRIAAGRAVISKVEEGGEIAGYNFVSLNDAAVGALTAGSDAVATTTTWNSNQRLANANADVVTTVTNSIVTARTYLAYGTLQAKKSTAASAAGFNSVSLDEVAVDGEVTATEADYDEYLPEDDQGRWTSFAGTYNGKVNAVFVDDEQTQLNSVGATSVSAIGALTANEGSVGGIKGYATVKLNEVDVAEEIAAGKFAYTTNNTATLKGENVYEQRAEARDMISLGTLSVQEGTVGGDVKGFAVVTATDATFGAGILEGGKESSTSTSNTVSKQEEDPYIINEKTIDSKAAAGKLSLKDSSVAGNIEGYVSVVGSALTVEGNIEKGWTKVSTTTHNYKLDENTDAESVKFTSNNTTTASGSLKLSNDSVVGGSIEGFANVTAEDTTIGAGIEAGKTVDSWVYTYNRTVRNDVVTEVIANANDVSESAGNKLYLNDSVLGGGEITGFQTVTIKDTEGAVDLIKGGNLKESESYKNTLVDDELTARTYRYSVAKTASSSLVVTDGDDEDFAAEKVNGFTKISADYGSLGEIYRIAVNEEAEEEFPIDRKTVSVNYNKTATKSTLKAAQEVSFTTSGNVVLSGTAEATAINGFTGVTLKEVTVNGNIEGLTWADSASLSSEKDANDSYVSSSYRFASKESPSINFNATKSNAAVVKGFKTAVINESIVEGLTDGAATITQDNFSVSLKGEVYTGAETHSSTRKAVGSVKIDKSQMPGTIEGASKVIATKSEIGALISSANTDMTSKKQVVGGSLEVNAADLPEDELLGEFEYAFVDVDDTTTKYSYTFTQTYVAKASASLSETIVDGNIEGYGAVSLLNDSVLGGNASAWSTRADQKITYDKGVYTYNWTETNNVIGSFTAQYSDVEGFIAGFATVTLNVADIGGDILGGKTVTVETAKGEGDTFAEASDDAWEDPDSKTTTYAAGVLRATDTYIEGAIRSFKSITFAGDNEIQGGIYGVSSDKDAVAIAARSALTLTENAVIGHVDEDNEEFNAIDSLTIGGTLRIAVDSVDSLELEVNKIAGKGMIAVQEDDYDAIKEMLVAKVGPAFDIVNGGDSDAIKTIRTRAEELSDNAQARATLVKTDTEINGWLCGTDENDMFKDTEDWISFSKEKGSWTANTYEVELIGAGDGSINAELWSGATKINEDVWREDTGSGFALNTANLGNYASVQLKLFVEDDVTPVSYAVSVHSVA